MAAAFIVNGSLYANWVPRIPDIRDALDLSAGALGSALTGLGAGAILGSLLAGPVIARLGSRRTTVLNMIGAGALLWLPAAAPSWAALAGALFLLGALDAQVDIAMNAHGAMVQRRYGRSIFNSFHAMWSCGAATGAVTGSLAVAAGVSPAIHLAIAGLGWTAVGVLASRWLLPGSEDRIDRTATVPSRGLLRRRFPGRVGALLGLLALFVVVVEGAPGDWSALYVTRELGGPAAMAGAGYAAFAAAMILGRLAGDVAVRRWGAVAVVRTGAVLAGSGFAATLLTDRPVLAVMGFAVVGLGISTLFPLAFSAAGMLPGVPAGDGIAAVSLVARLGFMISPPLIGGLADLSTLTTALWVTVAGAAMVFLLAPSVATVDRSAPDEAAGPTPLPH